MPKSKEDPREFANESLRGSSIDREDLHLKRVGEATKARDVLVVGNQRSETMRKLAKAVADAEPGTLEPIERDTSDIAQYFSGIPGELLTGLPEAIKSLPGPLGEDMEDILAGAQQALEMRDSEED